MRVGVRIRLRARVRVRFRARVRVRVRAARPLPLVGTLMKMCWPTGRPRSIVAVGSPKR